MMMLKGNLTAALGLSLLGTFGCSDPVPPPPQGGVNVNIRSAPSSVTPPNKKCTVGGHSAFVGSPPPDATKPGSRVVDGESGASVSCSVRKSGGVFKINGNATHKGVSFSVTGEVAPEGTGTATILHRNPTVLETVKNEDAMPCTVSVADAPLQVATGRVWAKFSCPALIAAQQPTLFCEGEGFFVFENCDE
ncbi:MAG TPA: hypothetical protein PKA88_27230 [Polyangiaceae bacterium]|nr:hypothetical protein [Polyangiaceae bacterium]